MKRILIVILVLILIFAFVRITTSTYENLQRSQNVYVIPIPEYGMLQKSESYA